ncbi:TlpA family protein disulfide reductase [Anatilimnocola floriformis]|uniref:TlpA family protein disulfide reductase n=1 Tax=Anatilimnocola floriformis TaxID=2948575 RepID=UPI0020C46D98|nr:hypothetical protein [Anatilimnocola floriformis]
MNRRARVLVGSLFCSFALLAALIGCQNDPPAKPVTTGGNGVTPVSQATAEKGTPNEMLQQLLAAYRGAQSYQDQAVVKLQFRRGGEQSSFAWPMSVAFQRPNKLSLKVYQAEVRIDGKEFKASINDPESNNVDGQIVVRKAPEQLKLTELANDPLLYEILSGRARRQPIQLELLLESRGLANAFAVDVACQALEDGVTDGKSCRRIAVPSPGGNFVFWIDRDQPLLRRLDYPAAALLPDLGTDSSVSDLQFWVELPGAQLGAQIAADKWNLPTPAGAKIVKSFVTPPRPLPSQLFGKQPGEFYFTTLDDRRLTQAQLTEKISILCWYHDNPACEATLQQIALAAKEFKDHPQVVFQAVATDPLPATSAQIQSKLKAWQVELPVVRDLEAFGDKIFKIQFQPAVIVFDKQGRVQIFELGGNPELAKQLSVIIERLLKGDDIAGELLASSAREHKDYAELIAMGGKEPEPVVELTEAVIRRKSDPKQLKLTPLWDNAEIKNPGNILFVPGRNKDEQPKLIVCEGWRNVVEVDLVGKVIRRYELELPEQAAVTYLRTTVDKEGKRFYIGSAPLAPQWFLFDDQFRVLRAYPELDQSLRITDIQLADVDDDGTAEVLAANVGLLGLHVTTLQGEMKWRNRGVPNVISLAVTHKNDVGSWQILLTGEAGSVLPLNRFGREEPLKTVPNWPLARLAVASFPTPTQSSFVGISNDASGNLVAVGLTSQLRECWNYQLPAGAHQQPIDPIASSNMLEGHQGEWWFAGADGSIHLVTEDGKLHDSFARGAVLSGLAAAEYQERGMLIISATTGLSAVQVSK